MRSEWGEIEAEIIVMMYEEGSEISSTFVNYHKNIVSTNWLKGWGSIKANVVVGIWGEESKRAGHDRFLMKM